MKETISFRTKKKNKTSARPKSGSEGVNPRAGRNSNPRAGRTPRKKPVSTIDPRRLVKKAQQVEVVPFVPAKPYAEMNLHANLKANLFEKGFTHPTQIQEETIEPLIDGRNLMGIANTGTGKTGSFLIPIIEQLLHDKRSVQALVVVPTRELALQVTEEFRALAAGLGLYTTSLIGGTNINTDIKNLRRYHHVIVGTPGRLLDLANRKALSFQKINTLVLDEFDRMLDMGFVNDIKRIVAAMPRRQQTMLFSATVEPSQKRMIDELMDDPVEVRVSSGKTTNEQIDQDVIYVNEGDDKYKMLADLLAADEFERVLLFIETKRFADRISRKLSKSGILADVIHGDKSQNYRNKALSKFKKGQINVLVATDVAARGIDVDDVTHVINYALPLSYDTYVHRIGRTGRAGKQGKAFTFVDQFNK